MTLTGEAQETALESTAERRHTIPLLLPALWAEPKDGQSREATANFRANLDRALYDLSEKVKAIIEGHREKPPETLFHYTNCDGLVGILGTKTIWASLATSLGDASETTYALERYKSRMLSHKGRLPAEKLAAFLENERVSEAQLTSDYRG